MLLIAIGTYVSIETYVSWYSYNYLFTFYYYVYYDSKGQLISEWLFDVLNFPKKQHKIWWISALESKKWLNQKDKGTLLH